jgi:5'-methylthioadenosine phosphorylase
MNNELLAIIGGTGANLRGPNSPLKNTHDETVSTRWGEAFITYGELGNQSMIFLHRHSALDGSHIPPHKINYRANIAALKFLGVTGILASNAVGSLRPEWKPGALVLVDDFLDFTTSRDKTFFDDCAVHIDVTRPYCERLRELLLSAARDENITLIDGGVYACTDGPRFETAAEIRAYKTLGADVVGMTGVPEIVLAREANISYLAIAIVTNAAAGVLPEPLTQAEVMEAMRDTMPQVSQLFLRAAQNYTDDPSTRSRRVTVEFGSPSVL